MKTDLITFEKILEKGSIEFSSSFVHGVFSVLCCQPNSNFDWADWLVDDLDPQDILQKEALKKLDIIKRDILEDLTNESFEFTLLVGQYDESLLDSFSFTRDWVSGFLFALSKTQLDKKVLSDSLSYEFILDLEKILLCLKVDENDIDQESEIDLLEVQEYLRTGTMNLYYETNI